MIRTIPSVLMVAASVSRVPRKDAIANRERVLDAATELVRRDGEKVLMAEIASHAGVGVGTVYRHFVTRSAPGRAGAPLVLAGRGQRARGRRRSRLEPRRGALVPRRHAP